MAPPDTTTGMADPTRVLAGGSELIASGGVSAGAQIVEAGAGHRISAAT
jgi:hypothetical protein